MQSMYSSLKLSISLFFAAVAVIQITLPLSLASANTEKILNAVNIVEESDGTDEFFEKKVRPILMTNCARCHNSKSKIAELDLTTSEGFAAGGEGGPVIDRDNLPNSRILKVISYEDTLKMPPKRKLGDEDIKVIGEWVKMGAPWPGASTSSMVESNPTTWRSSTREFTDDEKKYWAYQPVSKQSPPPVKNSSWIKSPIDAFILNKLEEKGIEPSKPTDKTTLLRRATFDLTGLPPTESEIKDFLGDSSPKAFSKVIDRLLSSPRYGEKWGRHWLDVARYADSTGSDEDHRYPDAWKYRDYVIESFNKDRPYDQFVREQLAGDLLPHSSQNDGPVNRRGIIATGFLAIGPKAIAQQDKKKLLYDVYDEQVDVTTKAFLGLTVACARCHNHKFDPILTKDYYSLVGIFASTKSFKVVEGTVSQVVTKPLVTKEEYDAWIIKRDAHREQLKLRNFAIAEIVDKEQTKLISTTLPRMSDYMVAARDVYLNGKKLSNIVTTRKLSASTLKKWVEYLKPATVRHHLVAWHKTDDPIKTSFEYQQQFSNRLKEWNEKNEKWHQSYINAIKEGKKLPDRPEFESGEDRFFADLMFTKKGPYNVSADNKQLFNIKDKNQIASLKEELKQLKKVEPPSPEMACAIEEGENVNQKVFIRGDYRSEGEPAPKAFPLILSPHTRQSENFTGSGRQQLAEWITQPEHPLTARVMVNRVWQWHFGEGIVRTPDNFGKMGELPSHPELLDFMAQQFVSNGWSVKTLHKMIMLSNTYQISSETSDAAFTADPENRLFSRFNRRRLSVEEIRDSLLAIDASIDLTMGGTLQSGTGTDSENDNKRLSLNPEKLTRRTVYLPLRRANLPTLLNLFDFGDAGTPSGKRQLTNVPTQALFWMNSEFLTERSKKLAQSLLNQTAIEDKTRVDIAYRRILNRYVDNSETEQALTYIQSFKQKYSKSDLEGWQSFCRILMTSNDFVYVD